MYEIPKNTLTTFTRFFGNFCNIEEKFVVIRAFQFEIEKLIDKENEVLQDIQAEYDQDPMLFDRKLFFGKVFKNNLRYATVISLVTLLEIELQNYCIELQRALSLKIKYDEFKGSILAQFKTYTSKLANLNIEFENQLWSNLRDVVELRNCIIHFDGYVEDWYGRKFNRVASIENLTKKFSSIEIDDREIIILDKNACKDCIDIVEKFIKHIYECTFIKFPEKEGV
jgi:hypothetical protein